MVYSFQRGNMLCSHDDDGGHGDGGDDDDGDDYVGDVAGDHDDDDDDEEGKRRLISIDKTGAARLSINLPPRLLFHRIFYHDDDDRGIMMIFI